MAEMQARPAKRLVALERQKQRPHPPEAIAAPAYPGRRIALVIGNSGYQTAGRLVNPANDARAIAGSFRRLGFAEVIERYDLDLASMSTAIKYFGDRSADADWAVVYYSGHGLEMNGIAYLIPVDARLERDTHVSDETVALSARIDPKDPEIFAERAAVYAAKGDVDRAIADYHAAVDLPASWRKLRAHAS